MYRCIAAANSGGPAEGKNSRGPAAVYSREAPNRPRRCARGPIASDGAVWSTPLCLSDITYSSLFHVPAAAINYLYDAAASSNRAGERRTTVSDQLDATSLIEKSKIIDICITQTIYLGGNVPGILFQKINLGIVFQKICP